MSQKLINKKEFVIHNYDYKIKNTYSLIERELSPYNIELIKKYDSELVKQSLAKATRLKHLQIILNLSRFIKKNWNEVTKDDVDRLVMKVVHLYGSDSGQETNTTWDHKKILKKVCQIRTKDTSITGPRIPGCRRSTSICRIL